MDDAELTRLAVAEIVREMGDLKESPVNERKINPIAKPNKRFLGRTLNSVLSHNKRENDRTQANCRKKLEELDERREPVKHRPAIASWDIVLSSSTEEDRKKSAKKRKKDKTKSKNHKKYRKRRNKSKKRKSKMRDSSSSTESSSSSSTKPRRSSRKHKSSQHNKQDVQKHVIEEQAYYEPDINAALELDAALMADSYRQHQIQQLLYYSALMVGNETSEIHALEEEMQISDIDFTEPHTDKKSISSAVSSLNLEDGDSEGSDILQISLSSVSSKSSRATSCKIMRRKRVKEKPSSKRRESSNSSNEVIWELDSDSETANASPKEKTIDDNRGTSDDCICIISETDTNTDTDTQNDSDSTTNEAQSVSENVPNILNRVCHTEAETVTLLSSSESEIEIFDDEPFIQEERSTVAAVISTSTKDLSYNEVAKEMPVNLIDIDGEKSMASDLDMPATLVSTSQYTTLCSEQVQLSIIAMLPTSFNSDCASSPGELTAAAADMKMPESRPSSTIIFTEHAQQLTAVVLNETLSLEEKKDSTIISFPSTVIEKSSNSSIPETNLMSTFGCMSSPEKVTTSAGDVDACTPTSQFSLMITCLERSQDNNLIENESVSVEEVGDLSNMLTPLTAHLTIIDCKSSHERSTRLPPIANTLVSESKLPVCLSTIAAKETNNPTVIKSISVAVAEVPLDSNLPHNPDSKALKSSLPLLTHKSAVQESDSDHTKKSSANCTSDSSDEQISSINNTTDSTPLQQQLL